MKKQIFVAASALLLAASILLAQEHVVNVDTKADGDEKIVKIFHGETGEAMAEELNLTEAQQKDFKKLDLAFEKETLAMRNELGVKKLDLEIALDEDNPDLKEINSLIDEIHQGEANIAKQRVATQLKKRALLTDEQKKNWVMHSPMHTERKFIMHGGPEDNMLWLDEGDMDMSAPRHVEKEVMIHSK